MKKNLLLAVFIVFVVIFGLALSFKEYNMLNPKINLSLFFIGGIGTTVLGLKIVKS